MEQQHFVDVFWKNREGIGQEFLLGGRGDRGACLDIFKTENDGDLRELVEGLFLSCRFFFSVMVCMHASGGGDEALEPDAWKMASQREIRQGRSQGEGIKGGGNDDCCRFRWVRFLCVCT